MYHVSDVFPKNEQHFQRGSQMTKNFSWVNMTSRKDSIEKLSHSHFRLKVGYILISGMYLFTISCMDVYRGAGNRGDDTNSMVNIRRIRQKSLCEIVSYKKMLLCYSKGFL